MTNEELQNWIDSAPITSLATPDIAKLTAVRHALQSKLDISRRKLTELSKAEALENLYQLAMGQEREIVKLEKERDALTMAAKLALGALMKSAVYLFDIETDCSVATVESINEAIEALKKAGVK